MKLEMLNDLTSQFPIGRNGVHVKVKVKVKGKGKGKVEKKLKLSLDC